VAAQAAGTQALALTLDELGAGRRVTHWLALGLAPRAGTLAGGARAPSEGRNDLGLTGYLGPCPAAGPPHRYVFTLYALSAAVTLPATATRADFDRAIAGNVIGQVRLVGLFGV
jgi:phosphatidylethanolamine-binding protein (PEBP) family uncharacterized protein